MAIDMKALQEMFFAECEEFLDLAHAQINLEGTSKNLGTSVIGKIALS